MQTGIGAGRTASLLGVLAFASAVLCLTGIGGASLWIDEAHSFESAALSNTWLVILNAAARDAHPPLYFVLLHFWMKLGQGEVWLRLFSTLSHLLTIPLVYLAGKRLISRDAGLIAAALVAFSPFHLAFAREVRMYSMVGALSVLSMWGLLRWESDRSRGAFWTWTLSGLALVYTHFIGMFLLAAQLVFLVSGRRRAIPWVAAAKWLLLLAVGFLAWSPFFLKAFLITHGYGAQGSAPMMLFNFLGSLGAGFAQSRWVLALGAGTFLVIASAGWLSLPATPSRRLLACWAFVPLLLEIAVSALGKPVFGERTLIMSTPAWILLVSGALSHLSARRAAVSAAFLGIVSGLGAAQALSYGLETAPSSREAVKYVLARANPPDAILHSSTVTYHSVHEYYIPRERAVIRDYMVEPPQGAFAGGRMGEGFRSVWRNVRDRLDPGRVIRTGKDPFRIGEAEFLGLAGKRVWYFRTTMEGSRRLWYLMPSVYYSPAPGKIGEKSFDSYAVLRRHFILKSARSYPGLVVELWERI